MVANHNRLKKCVDRDLPLWLSRFQEKFRGPVPGGGGKDIPVSSVKAGGEGAPPLSDSLVSTLPPGIPVGTP